MRAKLQAAMRHLPAVALCWLALGCPSVAAAPPYDLRDRFVELPSLPAEGWVEVRSPNFTVVSNADEYSARAVLYQFEQIRGLFQNTYRASVDPGKPIVILALNDEYSLRELAPRFWEKRGQMHPAGLFQRGPERNYVALRLDAAFGAERRDYTLHVIYHEYVHLLTSLNFERLPLWLSEGLAEFYGNTVIQEKDVRIGGVSPSQVEVLRQEKHLPLAVLLGAGHSSPFYSQTSTASMFYAQAWALTHYLVMSEEAGRGRKLADYVTMLGRGVEEAEARQRAFGSTQRLEERLRRYITEPFAFTRVRLPVPVGDVAVKSRWLREAESAAVRGDFLRHIGEDKEARSLLGRAVRLDPKLTAAHESLGMLHYQRDDYALAERSLSSAMRLKSRSFLAHFYHAMLAARRGGDRAPVERGLRRSIELNPGFAPAYSALAEQFAKQPERLEEALAMADRAAELEPDVSLHRLNIATVAWRLGRAVEAARLGELALSMARSDDERAAARDFLGALRRAMDPVGPRRGDREAPQETETPRRKSKGIRLEARRDAITLPRGDEIEPALGAPEQSAPFLPFGPGREGRLHGWTAGGNQ